VAEALTTWALQGEQPPTLRPFTLGRIGATSGK